MSDGLVPGPDGRLRCAWGVSTPEYVAYHDEEWGRPVRDDRGLYERLCLEAFQSGLSWLTILRKREGFRAAFAGFDPEAVAAFGDDDVARLMADAGIVRNRAKIDAAIANARAVARCSATASRCPSCCGRSRPASAPRRARCADVPAVDAGVDGDGQGAQAPRLPLRRPDHRVRADAGVRARQRPPGGMCAR